MCAKKTLKYMQRTELPDFLRQIADALEGKGVDGLDCPNDFRKLKLTAKEQYGQLEVKLKAGPDDPETCLGGKEFQDEVAAVTEASAGKEQSEPKRIPYKDLKERMKGSFKIIFRMIHDDQIPPREAVEEFLEDSRLMVTYSGYGDEYYDEYLEVCSAFSEAYESGSLEGLHTTVDMLQSLKSHCHTRYK